MRLTKIFLTLAVVSTIGMINLTWAQDTEYSLVPPNEERPQYLQKLQANNCTLVLVDYLTGFNPAIRSIDKERFQKNVAAVAQLGQIFKLPIIVLGDEGGYRGQFYQVIDEYYADSMHIARTTPSAWQTKDLRDAVEARGNKKLILSGISVDNCTMLTSLDAMAAGYEVYVLIDASGTTSELVEEVAIDRLVQAGAVPITWVTLGSELLTDWESPEGPKLGDLYAKMSPWGSADGEGSANNKSDTGNE